MERYNIKSVEKKWQDIWDNKKTNATIRAQSLGELLLINGQRPTIN